MPHKAGKDWLTTLLLCLVTGFLGGHRFYTGHITTGIIQALTMGACGLWWLADLATILAGRFRDSTGNRLVGSHYPAVTRWVIGTGVVCMILVILTMASID
ncbi:MAG TPA: TM2 domain-containing protein [Armatimonadota bacterium]|nr:TM2 domain-containing protein [Armatimonadota bacterium]HOJ20006.1 TM2 domain-containing protein [Armatimonadota bacterium]HOM82526.1 TM2 domain-containing protein [Armatimonadota bacterium]HPO72628.1 TM2 domain-containing protein [Armatimonadota bacterium]HPT97486.1 TM2 domain-containing protein [Armatimonadota bacterium]